MWRADGERLFALAAALAAALVAVTCHRGSRVEWVTPAPPAPSAAGKSAARAPALPSAGSVPGAAPLSSAPTQALPEALVWTRLYGALAGLDAKSRSEPVRVLWLGDSHTSADYLTGAARRRLEQRFGSGGPGFVRLGTAPYRHDGVRVVREGRWKVEPHPPSRRTPAGDGIFGLGGLRAVPLSKDARAELRVDPRRAPGLARYELLYELGVGSSLRVKVGKQAALLDAQTPPTKAPGSTLWRHRLEAEPGATLEISAGSGMPYVYGVLAEGSEPGIVIDTVGIDGARVATALAWNAEAFAAEVAARRPELVVVAFGTNEAFDARPAEAMIAEISELVARLRRGAPDADCLILGPPDAADRDLSSLPRIAEIEAAEQRAAVALGCGFFGLRVAMGGAGGFARWMRENPPLARADRVHLTPAGYERLGEALAAELIEGYERHGKRP